MKTIKEVNAIQNGFDNLTVKNTNEQVLVFFPDYLDSGFILDFTANGEIEQDVVDGFCFDTDALKLTPPKEVIENKECGLFIWEGQVGHDLISDEISYNGSWRRLSMKEIVGFVKGNVLVTDLITKSNNVFN